MKIIIFSIIREYENRDTVVSDNAYSRYEDGINAFNEEYEKLRKDESLSEYWGECSTFSDEKSYLYFHGFQEVGNERNTIKIGVKELELH